MTLDLGGESEKILLVTPQIICHPIDGDSPLETLSKKQLEALSNPDRPDLQNLNSENNNNDSDEEPFENFEIIVVLEGQVESTGMTMQARISYTPNEIKWGKNFANILETGDSPGYKVNFSKFHNLVEPKNDTEAESAAQRNEILKEANQVGDGDDIDGSDQFGGNDSVNLRRRNNVGVLE